jgi:hypothetical protein
VDCTISISQPERSKSREKGIFSPVEIFLFDDLTRRPRQPNLVKIEEHRAYKRVDFEAGEPWQIRTTDTLIKS